jgi:hypothetical protein
MGGANPGFIGNNHRSGFFPIPTQRHEIGNTLFDIGSAGRTFGHWDSVFLRG